LEYQMSLPARQQRALDGIAESLRMSEPRLAAMFAVFSRLTRNELPPRGEQLPDTGVLTRLAAARHRLPGTSSQRGRRAWRRALIVGQVAIAFVLLGLFAGVGAGSAGRCSPRLSRAVPVVSARGQACTAQAGFNGVPLGK
jgi:hypothetical protein